MPLFENFDRDFGTLGMGIVKIRLQIRTCRPGIRLCANFGKFGCIISVKKNQLACFFHCHPVSEILLKLSDDRGTGSEFFHVLQSQTSKVRTQLYLIMINNNIIR